MVGLFVIEQLKIWHSIYLLYLHRHIYMTKNDIRYYRINQDTDLYNSYCLDGHYDDCTGTQYIDASTQNQ